MQVQQLLQLLKTFVGEIYWREILLCTPAIMLVLAFSLDIDPLAAVIMVGAAFSVGFGASRTLGKYRWGAVALAALGMACSAVLGSLLGGHSLLLFGGIALLSAACAYLSGRNNDFWWVSLQIAVAFLVASYYPGGTEQALLRGVLVLTAGLLQLLGMLLFARLFPFSAALLPSPPADNLAPHQLQRFILTLVAAVLLAYGAARWFAIANDYWAPMTVLMVIKPSGQITYSRMLNRFIGTFVGCLLATALIYLLHEQQALLLICLIISSGLAFSMQKAHYALLTCMISATIVFLIALGLGNPIATTEHRLIATVLGGIIALLMVKLFNPLSVSAS
ncbi:fusaric acid resistance family protein [Mesocricetibacter intestinalis]|uniref:Fusaric acid resistance family protein n=1 Tax=Mesocricetibacter intestinalis TaxID=1521930 RepID=A0A4R6VBN5_9PAST|nr:FUSC family protein [Mesocricetibacter intestinalis]TDQ57929.1 fusaric acid resistance family protein [Mesocricetibacter intestinalis]